MDRTDKGVTCSEIALFALLVLLCMIMIYVYFGVALIGGLE